jgi:hypothetical protein
VGGSDALLNRVETMFHVSDPFNGRNGATVN